MFMQHFIHLRLEIAGAVDKETQINLFGSSR